MNEAMRGRLEDVADKLGWALSYDDNCGWELEKWSPAGEDFIVYLSGDEDPVGQMRQYADNFNEEEHVTDLLIAKRNGFGGVPSAQELVDDAKAIQEMLDELAKAFERAKESAE